MSGSASEMSRDVKKGGNLGAGSHVAYVFASSSEKQTVLFQICEQAVSIHNCYVLYLSGKQGVKGIRLSLKDVGFDVAFFERARQFKIVDSEEWFLTNSRQRSFKTNEELLDQISNVASEALSYGYPYATIISETDALVRKGFYPRYLEFDNHLGKTLGNVKAAFVCAFDQRELEAAGASNYKEDVRRAHDALL